MKAAACTKFGLPEVLQLRVVITVDHADKLVVTVPERTGAVGEEIIPLDEQAIRNVARQLVAEGVQSIAIGFLHAYLSPEHERLAQS